MLGMVGTKFRATRVGAEEVVKGTKLLETDSCSLESARSGFEPRVKLDVEPRHCDGACGCCSQQYNPLCHVSLEVNSLCPELLQHAFLTEDKVAVTLLINVNLSSLTGGGDTLF